jgi:hypothetical protein
LKIRRWPPLFWKISSYHTRHFPREGHPGVILSSCGLFVNWGASADFAAECENFPDADISELLSLLSQVPEFRSKRGREYNLSFILAVCVLATLAGAKNYREIATVASSVCQCQLKAMGARWDSFRSRYRYPRRTLIWKVLRNVDAAELDRITGKWLLAQARKDKVEDGEIEWIIAIDGKVLRGSWTDENNTVTLFSAMLQVKGITIAQSRVPDETNETTQVKTLLRQADIHGGESVLATLDAAHCNRETAEFIGGKPGWDYLITVKTDKPALYRAAKKILSPLLGSNPGNVMTEHSRGVIKTWSCWTSMAKEVNFPHIAQVACVCREVRSITGENLTKDVAVLVTSRNDKRMSAADLNKHALLSLVISLVPDLNRSGGLRSGY